MATTTDILGSNRKLKIPPRWSRYYQSLCAERDRLLARDGFTPAATQPKLDDLTDSATDESQRCLSLLAASATQATIVEVVQAIKRIERGTYGLCELTGEPIETERLKAIPWTRYSRTGQSELEKAGCVKKYALPSLDFLGEPALADGDDSESESDKNGTGQAQ